MKIVICDGHHEADYIIKMFKDKQNQLIIINRDKEFCKYLAKINRVPVLYGKSFKKETLDIAHIENADILISLNEVDTDNFATCIIAKKIFNVHKVICTVINPKNVELYKELGVDSVISSSYLLGNSVKSESSIESFIKTISLEDDKITMVETIVNEDYLISSRKIMEINFPKYANISCIYRKPNVIIPNGQTIILPKDKLIVVTTSDKQKAIIDWIQRTKTEENK